MSSTGKIDRPLAADISWMSNWWRTLTSELERRSYTPMVVVYC
jgi:hypothetical protein